MNRPVLIKVRRMSERGRMIFFFGTILLITALFTSISRIFIPIGLSYVLYLIVNPFIPMLNKAGLNKNLSILLIFVGLLFFAVYPLVKLSPVIVSEAENFQYFIPKIERTVHLNYEKIRHEIKSKTTFDIGEKLITDGIELSKKSSKIFLLKIPTLIASILEWIFLIPLFLFFFLKDGRNFKFLVLKMCPNSIFERLYNLIFKFNKQLGGYIFAKFVEASIVGIIITVGLLIMGVKFSLLLGFVAGVTNIIPYVGPIFGMIPAIALGIAEYGWGPTFGGIMLLYLIANVIDIALVFPILVSKIVDLHPIIVVLSVILGSQYMGTLGMVISIPLAAAIKLIFLELYSNLYNRPLP